MAHGHAHTAQRPESQYHDGPTHRGTQRALWLAFGITLTFTIAEAIGGWVSGSLALLADAGHMLTDTVALGLSLGAIWLTTHPPKARRTYGLYRAEILAAFLNGLTLFVICGLIFHEAWIRWRAPSPIQGGVMLLIAILGLLANAVTLWILWKPQAHAAHTQSLNLRSAFLHVIGDLLGSVGAIAAAGVVMTTGWLQADPLISMIIALLIVMSTCSMLYETIRVLLEIAPGHIHPEDVAETLQALPGVIEVHDVHVWTITTGLEIVSGHVRLSDDEVTAARLDDLLQRAHDELRLKFNVDHVTLQVEPYHCRHPQGRL